MGARERAVPRRACCQPDERAAFLTTQCGANGERRAEVESLLAAHVTGTDTRSRSCPRPFVADPDRRARFEREARLLASLNHPNIATIYGLEEQTVVVSGFSRTVRALELELVEGGDAC